jgi:hypothetical protein
MPKTELTAFQLDLLQRKRDKARIKQEQNLRRRIFTLAEESNKERKLCIAVANANKLIVSAIARKGAIVSDDEVDDEELGNNSSNDVKTASHHSSDSEQRNRLSDQLDRRKGRSTRII